MDTYVYKIGNNLYINLTFLPDDYLIKQRFPGMTLAQIRRYAERWKPWRSYALLHIWYTEGWQPDEA